MRSDTLPIMDNLIKGRVYKIRSRNLRVGVWNGKDGFIGIRSKFGDRYLFTEYHYDASETYGTVCDAKDTGIDIPENVSVRTTLGSIDSITKRPVAFDTPVGDGGKGWYFIDTGEPSEEIRSVSVNNKKLFDFIDGVLSNLG